MTFIYILPIFCLWSHPFFGLIDESYLPILYTNVFLNKSIACLRLGLLKLCYILYVEIKDFMM